MQLMMQINPDPVSSSDALNTDVGNTYIQLYSPNIMVAHKHKIKKNINSTAG